MQLTYDTDGRDGIGCDRIRGTRCLTVFRVRSFFHFISNYIFIFFVYILGTKMLLLCESGLLKWVDHPLEQAILNNADPHSFFLFPLSFFCSLLLCSVLFCSTLLLSPLLLLPSSLSSYAQKPCHN